MKSLKYFSSQLSRIQNCFSCSFFHNVATVSAPFSDPQNLTNRVLTTPQSHLPTQDHPRTISLLVSNSINLKQLRQTFGRIIRTNFLESYADSFHYNNIARLYSRLESPKEALNVYITMSRAGVQLDNFTLPIILKAATQKLDILLAKQIHGISFKHGLESDMYCESGLISLYCKVGEFDDARKVFVNNTDRKLGSWNAVISGLSQGGRAKEAVDMFRVMMRNGFVPDDVTMVSVFSACGSLQNLNLGFQLHKFVYQTKSFEKSDTLMMSSIIDMYSKCGRMDLAYEVFSEMEVKNVSSWTTMIVGYAAEGRVSDALDCFQSMRVSGIQPNQVTFVAVLSACVHGGMVQEGKFYFKMMMSDYRIRPRLAHYGCMADLLGRAGLLDEAILMVEDMPMKPNVVILGCLMGACEKYGNMRIGEWVAKYLIELDPENDGVFVALSNIYASNGIWKEVERIRVIMKEKKLEKIPAYSLPESS